MKIRKIIISIIVGYLIAIALIFSMIRNTDHTQLNVVEVNNIVHTLAANWSNSPTEIDLPNFDYPLDFVVISNNEEVLATTRDGLNTSIISAIANRDTIVDVAFDSGEVLGKVIFYNNSSSLNTRVEIQIVVVVAIVLTLFTIGIIGMLCTCFLLCCSRFKKWKGLRSRLQVGIWMSPLKWTSIICLGHLLRVLI